jgi:hypothetical protein
VGNYRSADLYTLQQLLTVSRIFCRDEIHRIQNLNRPSRDII